MLDPFTGSDSNGSPGRSTQDSHHDGSLESVRRENIVRVLRETGGVLAGPRGSSGAAGSEKDNVVFQN
jgi:hypothetical protein